MYTKHTNRLGYLLLSVGFCLWIAGGISLSSCSKPEGSCTTKADCAGGANCVNGKCVGECSTDDDCKKQNKVRCVNAQCQGCLSDSACPDNQKCINETCRTGCKEDKDCEYLGKNTVGQDAVCQLGSCILTCTSHGDCPRDYYCKSRACEKGEPPPTKKADELEACGDVGSSCSSDEDCKKGSCYKGSCLVDCMDGLMCRSWAGGNVQYCYKPCQSGCGKKICVQEQFFADKTEVCMNPVSKQGDIFSYNDGTFCNIDDGLVPLQPSRGQPGFGSGRCWVICDLSNPSCELGRKCGILPNATAGGGKPLGACFKECKISDDCEGISGLVCKPHAPACNDNSECGDSGPCEDKKCKSTNFCLPR